MLSGFSDLDINAEAFQHIIDTKTYSFHNWHGDLHFLKLFRENIKSLKAIAENIRLADASQPVLSDVDKVLAEMNSQRKDFLKRIVEQEQSAKEQRDAFFNEAREQRQANQDLTDAFFKDSREQRQATADLVSKLQNYYAKSQTELVEAFMAGIQGPNEK